MAKGEKEPISIKISKLLLDVENFRHGKQKSQIDSINAIIADQGEKLVNLAKDIIKEGLNPSDLPIAIEQEDGNYIVVEGNRRLAAIRLMLNPDLASGSKHYKSFSQIKKDHEFDIPKKITCFIASSKEEARIWIDRKHGKALKGAGTEEWSSIAKARAEADAGHPSPALQVVNFVLTNPNINPDLRTHLEGSDFSISTLERMMSELQTASEFSFKNNELISRLDTSWLQNVLTDVVTCIWTQKNGDKSFSVRQIDKSEDRKSFINELIARHPEKKEAQQNQPTQKDQPSTSVQKKETETKEPAKQPKVKETPSTEQRKTLVPSTCKLALPSGKINEVFKELKTLTVEKHPCAVAVLLRVFIELSLDNYIQDNSVQIPTDKNGQKKDTLTNKLQASAQHVKTNKRMKDKDLKAVNLATGDNNTLLSPETLNAYVHSPTLTPSALELKRSWDNIQLFIECLWFPEI